MVTTLFLSHPWARENGDRIGRRVEICDMRTRTDKISPSGEDDFDSDKTTLMRPSLAGTLPTTIVPFSDMMLVELTRTYLIRGVDSECLVNGDEH